MSELRQRTPRQKDGSYLAKVRRLPCVYCGITPCGEAAHVRMSAPGKLNAGVGAKPDDMFALPLCHQHHMLQHSDGERKFWRDMDKNPVFLCRELYHLRDDEDAMAAFILGHVDRSAWV